MLLLGMGEWEKLLRKLQRQFRKCSLPWRVSGEPCMDPFSLTRGWRRIGRGKSAWGLGWVVISHLSEGGKRNRRQGEGRVGPRIICGFISACWINGGRRSHLVKAEDLIYRPQRSHGALCMECLSVASLMWVGFCSGSRCVGEILMSELEGELFGLSWFLLWWWWLFSVGSFCNERHSNEFLGRRLDSTLARSTK